MKMRFIWIGKTRQPEIKKLVNEYLERIGKFAPVEVSELRDRTDAGTDARRVIEKEGGDILERVSGDQFVVALDERGEQIDSIGFAKLLEKHRMDGTRQMSFVLGGHAGLSDAVRKRAGLVLALSRMTLTHEMARLFLLEQVYRAHAIIHDLPYQK
ncbi:MAG TPA: 23S rRNA (pseudouridine(1915)-N(3))-methyltransferase RlmH [Blastocatellia bacterium]|nr:23S rRNA (pseudouridine(1915)-N(3))-methyltransferase RlmH [Blastocatellia bacterium]